MIPKHIHHVGDLPERLAGVPCTTESATTAKDV